MEPRRPKLKIILQLREMLHEHIPYIRTFKSAVENIHSTEYQIIIEAGTKPSLEHSRRFNLSACNEVVGLIAGEEHGKRDMSDFNFLYLIYKTFHLEVSQ
ncbi:hypothetical protein AVEN_86203-1 [Araneus ventricosus]|uniref:Uncharacterized protein n=1 Tax=Araneus ventricosus TaxID=182803 RepID=A0A4Y2JJW2_ARAVE|nr:hypothetical protein AVEN_86203-1 [Araneus ventricosus]